MRKKTKPRIRRVRLMYVDTWVWGLFQSPESRHPWALGRTPKDLARYFKPATPRGNP